MFRVYGAENSPVPSWVPLVKDRYRAVLFHHYQPIIRSVMQKFKRPQHRPCIISKGKPAPVRAPQGMVELFRRNEKLTPNEIIRVEPLAAGYVSVVVHDCDTKFTGVYKLRQVQEGKPNYRISSFSSCPPRNDPPSAVIA